MPGFNRLKFDEAWVGQSIIESHNPKRYVITSIESAGVMVRAVDGTNLRAIDMIALELNWFPAGATLAEEA